MMAQDQADCLENFSQECLKVGCLTGFKYFSCYLRGREELIVKVKDIHKAGITSPNQSKAKKFRVVSRGHPPASPCAREPFSIRSSSNDEFTFLVASYARYHRPMVWVRSVDSTKVHLSRDEVPDWKGSGSYTTPSDQDEDLPLRLYAIELWPIRPASIHIWDVIAEIVGLCITPKPANPFELDWEHDPVLSKMPCLPPKKDKKEGEGSAGQGEGQTGQNEPKPAPDSKISAGRKLFTTAGLISQFQIMNLENEPPITDDLNRLLKNHFMLMGKKVEKEEDTYTMAMAEVARREPAPQQNQPNTAQQTMQAEEANLGYTESTPNLTNSAGWQQQAPIQPHQEALAQAQSPAPQAQPYNQAPQMQHQPVQPQVQQQVPPTQPQQPPFQPQAQPPAQPQPAGQPPQSAQWY